MPMTNTAHNTAVGTARPPPDPKVLNEEDPCGTQPPPSPGGHLDPNAKTVLDENGEPGSSCLGHYGKL